MMIAIHIYHFFIFLPIGDVGYLVLALFIIFIKLVQFALNGFAFQYLMRLGYLSANINDNYHDRSHGDGLWGWRVQSLPAYISGFRWYFTRHSWGRPLCGMSLGVLPVNFLSTYGFQIGNVLMVFSLSFVFTDRFTLMGEAMKTGVYIDDILREVSIAHLEEENDMHQA